MFCGFLGSASSKADYRRGMRLVRLPCAFAKTRQQRQARSTINFGPGFAWLSVLLRVSQAPSISLNASSIAPRLSEPILPLN